MSSRVVRRCAALAFGLPVLGALAAAGFTSGPVGAASFPTVPAYGLPPAPSFEQPFRAPRSCSNQPLGATCERAAIYDLDVARHKVLPSAGPYRLPAKFLSMSPSQQTFILSDLDRAAYGEPVFGGENGTLDAWAAANNASAPLTDPQPPGWPSSFVDGVPIYAYGGNSAATYPNILFAYAAWMYDDGPGSPNVDCASNPFQCWGHRDNVLRNFSVNVCPVPFVNGQCPVAPETDYLADLAYGAAQGFNAGGQTAFEQLMTGGPGYPSLAFTWFQAANLGAGSHVFTVPSVTHLKASSSSVAPGAKITFTARVSPPPVTAAKVSWGGIASSCHPVNAVKATGVATCTVRAPRPAGPVVAGAHFAGNLIVAPSTSKAVTVNVG